MEFPCFTLSFTFNMYVFAGEKKCIFGGKTGFLTIGKAVLRSETKQPSRTRPFLGSLSIFQIHADPPRIQADSLVMWQIGFMQPERWINDLSKKAGMFKRFNFFYITVLAKAVLGFRGSRVSQEDKILDYWPISKQWRGQIQHLCHGQVAVRQQWDWHQYQVAALSAMPSQPLWEAPAGGWRQNPWSSQGASAPLKVPAQLSAAS